MSDNIKIITTEDGSQSLYNQKLNETYHSTHGALTESKHVFIKHGLEYLMGLGKEQIQLLEVGFGTGLNTILAQEFSAKFIETAIEYVSLEPFPLSSDIIADLKYHRLLSDQISRSDFEYLHSCDWGRRHELTHNFTFIKYLTELQNFRHEANFDLVFYDAFAPAKQAEMWDVKVLEYTMSLMSNNSILVTYCAKGQFKRDLRSLGFSVEALPGPPGKHEMVRAMKP